MRADVCWFKCFPRDRTHTDEHKELNREDSFSSTVHFHSSEMERVLILLVAAALMISVSPGVQGTAHLSFANNTEVIITRDGCGSTKLCVETPSGCDPAMNSSCLFASFVISSVMAPNGSVLSVDVRGDSEGYVAMGLTADPTQGSTMLFVCAQNSSANGTFFFRTMDRNNTNGNLETNERMVREIRGMVEGNIIRCEFDIPNVNSTATRMSSDTAFSVLLGSGPVNGNSIGPFNVSLTSRVLDFSNPAGNATANTTNATNVNATTVPATTAGSGSVYPHAVLMLLSVLTLPFMLRG